MGVNPMTSPANTSPAPRSSWRFRKKNGATSVSSGKTSTSSRRFKLFPSRGKSKEEEPSTTPTHESLAPSEIPTPLPTTRTRNTKQQPLADETEDETSFHDNPRKKQPSHPRKNKQELFAWQDQVERQSLQQLKQSLKERDGFCRRVVDYDGQTLYVQSSHDPEGAPQAVYRLGNYLGGGVAGVVYQGHRLRPLHEYPTRTTSTTTATTAASSQSSTSMGTRAMPPPPRNHETTLLCGATTETVLTDAVPTTTTAPPPAAVESKRLEEDEEEFAAIETTPTRVILDAPVRDDTVAIKILNPVGFRCGTNLDNAVVVVPGEDYLPHCPIETRHVWWCVHPNSRNLRTLQRTSQVDRGSPERGLRVSLVAAYRCDGILQELPLTKCLELWGHVPFGATDAEFETMIAAIERVNAGQAPLDPNNTPALPRVGTGGSSTTASLSVDDLRLTETTNAPIGMATIRTGLYRAACSARSTVYCKALSAYIAIPAVPSKYLRWLRQRRAATKEIRNMMLIGRHPNVVHLFEVLELVQDTKSTMFLILELVRGGELFDLISAGAGTQTEERMRNFFLELASGVQYCHSNGIAHRDLKPENLLVHNHPSGDCTLKIADFGLSAAFGHIHNSNDQDTVVDSLASPTESLLTAPGDPNDGRSISSTVILDGQAPVTSTIPAPPSEPQSTQPTSPIQHFANALNFLTCGAMDDVVLCAPSSNTATAEEELPSPLRRMTSVVGSPHYVAPEIISQHAAAADDKRRVDPSSVGYDGTKADVWSVGVILYAMLFRSLPFGEDLLRCPRYQSYRKWYLDAKGKGGRRSSAAASLHPVITVYDEEHMLGPHWFFPTQTSKESRDLIVAMLNPDPAQRLTIQMVLMHPWLLSVQSSTSRYNV